MCFDVQLWRSVHLPFRDVRRSVIKLVTQFSQGAASKFARSESDDSSVTFSNSGSTPNGSPLGSETEEEANDEELAK